MSLFPLVLLQKKKKGQRRRGKKGKKWMRKGEGRCGKGRKENGVGAEEKERMNGLQRYLCPGNYIVAIQRNL